MVFQMMQGGRLKGSRFTVQNSLAITGTSFFYMVTSLAKRRKVTDERRVSAMVCYGLTRVARVSTECPPNS